MVGSDSTIMSSRSLISTFGGRLPPRGLAVVSPIRSAASWRRLTRRCRVVRRTPSSRVVFRAHWLVKGSLLARETVLVVQCCYLVGSYWAPVLSLNAKFYGKAGNAGKAFSIPVISLFSNKYNLSINEIKLTSSEFIARSRSQKQKQ